MGSKLLELLSKFLCHDPISLIIRKNLSSFAILFQVSVNSPSKDIPIEPIFLKRIHLLVKSVFKFLALHPYRPHQVDWLHVLIIEFPLYLGLLRIKKLKNVGDASDSLEHLDNF